jgi:hypothetical protein
MAFVLADISPSTFDVRDCSLVDSVDILKQYQKMAKNAGYDYFYSHAVGDI